MHRCSLAAALQPRRLCPVILIRVELALQVAFDKLPLRPDPGQDRGDVVVAVSLQLHVLADLRLVGPILRRVLQGASKVLQLLRNAGNDVFWQQLVKAPEGDVEGHPLAVVKITESAFCLAGGRPLRTLATTAPAPPALSGPSSSTGRFRLGRCSCEGSLGGLSPRRANRYPRSGQRSLALFPCPGAAR